MRLVIPSSEVVTDHAGLTWLQPVEASTRTRHTLGTFLLAVAILVGMATSTLLPPAGAVPATGVVVAGALWLLWWIVAGAGSKVAVSGVGLYVQDGGRAHELGWAAVRGVAGDARRAGVHIVVDDGYRRLRTRAPFEPGAARSWLSTVLDEAGRRGLEPVATTDGLGFSATGHNP